MSEQKHTPGPWHVGMRPGPFIYGAKGEGVANCQGLGVEEHEDGHNARRIVACVNACEGISTETLEASPVHHPACKCDSKAVQQRDELLAALLELIEQLEAIGVPDWHGAEGLDLAQARAAIAKAKP